MTNVVPFKPKKNFSSQQNAEKEQRKILVQECLAAAKELCTHIVCAFSEHYLVYLEPAAASLEGRCFMGDETSLKICKII